MPIIPLLTDSDENLESLFAGGAEAKADYILPGLLNLKGLDKAYKKSFYQKLSKINEKYRLTMGHRLPKSIQQVSDDDGQQLSLF